MIYLYIYLAVFFMVLVSGILYERYYPSTGDSIHRGGLVFDVALMWPLVLGVGAFFGVILAVMYLPSLLVAKLIDYRRN